MESGDRLPGGRERSHLREAEEEVASTAFTCPFTCRSGTFACLALPAGLSSAPATYAKLLDKMMLRGMGSVKHYIDDVGKSGTKEEHLAQLRLLYDRVRETGLKLRADKTDRQMVE